MSTVFSAVNRADAAVRRDLEEWGQVAAELLERARENNSPLLSRIEANAGIIALIQEGALLQPEDFRGVRDRVGSLQAGAIITNLGNYLYLDFLASAPWNITGDSPKSVKRAATILIAQIVRESIALGYEGRVTVDAVGGTVSFYQTIGFIETEQGSTITPEMVLTPEAARDFLDNMAGE